MCCIAFFCLLCCSKHVAGLQELQQQQAETAWLPEHVMPADAEDMPPGESAWLSDDQAHSWWARSMGPGGAYVLPAVVVTSLALGGLAAFFLMKRRRML